MQVRCPACGRDLMQEASARAETEMMCQGCGRRWDLQDLKEVERDMSIDDWLEGAQASVRSRRSFGEQRF